ncbi:MAG: AAA family ATPase [Sphingopyxis sp.]
MRAVPPAPLRSVLTGGPGAGKSTLLAALAAKGVPTFPEVARAILQSSGGMAMRAERPMDFAMAMLDAELAAWHRAESGPALYDRGFPDIAGFLELEGLAVPDKLDQICHDLRYTGPIFRAPPWRMIYAPDSERTQDWEQAVASDTAIGSAWLRYGYALIDLPLAPIAERAAFVQYHLQ